MKLFASLMITVIFSGFLLGATAQQKSEAPSTGVNNAAEEQAGGTTTRNTAELDRFANFVLGSWAVRESHEASDMGPAGSSAGTALFRKGPGGFSIIENLRTTGSQGRFEGLGITWWDARQQAYKTVWCDSSAPECDAGSAAKWEGGNLVAHSQMDMPGGKKVDTKGVYSEITPKSFTFTMYAGTDENSMKPFMTMRYIRKSSPSAATKSPKN